MKIDARQGTKSQVLQLFQDVCEKRGVRYATVEPISIEITSGDKKNLNFRASKGKFTSQKSLKLWGDVFKIIVEATYYAAHDSFARMTSVCGVPNNFLDPFQG